MTERARAGDGEGPAADEREILEELLETPAEPRSAATPGAPSLIAECVDARHPTLQGRVKVVFAEPGGPERALWVPALQGLSVRASDRVLLVRPLNAAEWVVTGVVDGFVRRPEVAKQTAARLELLPDEAVHVVSSAGQPLVEISAGERGPQVKILEPDVRVAFAGKLAISAADIRLEATDGEVTVQAKKDVVVKGEVIQLN